MSFDAKSWIEQAEADGSKFIVELTRDEHDPTNRAKWTFSVWHSVDGAHSERSMDAEIDLWTAFRQPGAKEAVKRHLIETRGFVGAVPPMPTQQNAHVAA